MPVNSADKLSDSELDELDALIKDARGQTNMTTRIRFDLDER